MAPFENRIKFSKMSVEKTQEGLMIGKKYKFPVCSTKNVTVEKTTDHYIVFNEKEILHHGEYSCVYHNEEEEETGVKKDVLRNHYWENIVKRDSIFGTHIFRHHDEDFWQVEIYTQGAKDIALVFYKRENAERIFSLIQEYVK